MRAALLTLAAALALTPACGGDADKPEDTADTTTTTTGTTPAGTTPTGTTPTGTTPTTGSGTTPTDTGTAPTTPTTPTDTGTAPTTGSGVSPTTPTDTAVTTTPTTPTTPTDTGPTTPTDTGDTGVVVASHDGVYYGTFVVNASSLFLGNDSCAGSLTVTVVEAVAPQITGYGDCVGGSWLGLVTVTLEGYVTVDPLAAGDLTATAVGMMLPDTWDGSFAADNLSGSFNGSVPGLATYTGSFSVDR